MNAVDAAERARCDAMVAVDVAALDQLLSDDLSWIHSSGKQDDKRSLLAMIAADAPYISIDLSDQRVRRYGNVAISNGLATIRARGRGGESDRLLRNLFTNVWLIEGDGVTLVSCQSTKAPETR